MEIKNVGVFCAASDRLDAAYYALAADFGRWLGGHGLTLVYGGADSGLMESVAEGVKAVSRHVDELVKCNDLNDRKAIMLERSDVMVALPGGIGTLDEVFTTMAAHSIGYHRKRVVLFALDGFWDGLAAVLEEMDRRGFINVPLDRYLSVARSWDELEAALG